MLIMGLLGEGDYQSEKDESVNYCEMVDLYLTSGGENGWPPYRGTDECDQ